LPSKTKGDILFWQEGERGDIPGNMQVILRGDATRAARVIVQKRASYDKLIELGADEGITKRLGFVYKFEKENSHGSDALICTNSDRIEQCERIVTALPEIHFHIAALTEMSSKLMQMGNHGNVSLYPGVKMSTLSRLFLKCDYYLDINHESEIVSAVYQAFLHNELIFAFKDTMHNRDYVAAENRYSTADTDRMISDIRTALQDGASLEKRLAAQRAFALSEDAGAYARRLEA
jgi:accessory Sec system glycosyltransferase GtfB